MKPLVAHQNMKEFDPECERHFPVLLVKAVDPGCTIELQIERRNGQVERYTTGENFASDMRTFKAAVLRAFEEEWAAFEEKYH